MSPSLTPKILFSFDGARMDTPDSPFVHNAPTSPRFIVLRGAGEVGLVVAVTGHFFTIFVSFRPAEGDEDVDEVEALPLITPKDVKLSSIPGRVPLTLFALCVCRAILRLTPLAPCVSVPLSCAHFSEHIQLFQLHRGLHHPGHGHRGAVHVSRRCSVHCAPRPIAVPHLSCRGWAVGVTILLVIVCLNAITCCMIVRVGVAEGVSKYDAAIKSVLPPLFFRVYQGLMVFSTLGSLTSAMIMMGCVAILSFCSFSALSPVIIPGGIV